MYYWIMNLHWSKARITTDSKKCSEITNYTIKIKKREEKEQKNTLKTVSREQSLLFQD